MTIVHTTRMRVSRICDNRPLSDIADDLGSWMATGTRRTYFQFTPTNAIRYATGVPSSNEYILLTRRYYVHKTYNRFHRIISDIKGKMCPVMLRFTCIGRCASFHWRYILLGLGLK